MAFLALFSGFLDDQTLALPGKDVTFVVVLVLALVLVLVLVLCSLFFVLVHVLVVVRPINR